MLLRSSERQYSKVESLAQHLVACGLRSPSERTQTTICALLMHTSSEEGAMQLEEDVTRQTALLATVKAVVKAKVLRAKNLGTPLLGGTYITELPATVAELPTLFQQQFFEAIPAYEPPIDLNPVWRSANAWVCRSTNQRVRPEASQGLVGQHAMMQQTALVAANMIALAASGPGAAGLPGLQIFAAGSRRQEPAASTQLRQLMDRVDAPAVETPGMMAESAATEVAPRMLALEDGQACVAPEGAVTRRPGAADLEHKVRPTTVAATEREEPSPPTGEPLEKTLAALAQAHYKKDMPEMPASPASNSMPSSEHKGLKRPAFVLRKPAASKAAVEAVNVLKRPASKQIGMKETVLHKQEPNKKQTAMKANPKGEGGSKKKAAAAKAAKGKVRPAKSGKGTLQTISRKVAAKKYPKGCSRCRQRPGCTPSCWLRRNYRLSA